MSCSETGSRNDAAKWGTIFRFSRRRAWEDLFPLSTTLARIFSRVATRLATPHRPRSTAYSTGKGIMSLSPFLPVDHAEFIVEAILFDMDGTLV